MFSESAVVLVSAPDVPVIVTAAAPGVAVALAMNVAVLLEVVGLGLKLALTPAGNPDADKVTLPVNPPEGATVIVLLPLLPWLKVNWDGKAESVKSEGAGGGRTQSLAALENKNWIV